MKYYSSRLGLSFEPAKMITFIRQTAGINEDNLSDYEKGYAEGLEAMLEAVFSSLEEEMKTRIENFTGVTEEENPQAYEYLLSRALGNTIEKIFPQAVIQLKKHLREMKEINPVYEGRDTVLEIRRKALRELDLIAKEWEKDNMIRKTGTILSERRYSGMGLEKEKEEKTENNPVRRSDPVFNPFDEPGFEEEESYF